MNYDLFSPASGWQGSGGSSAVAIEPRSARAGVVTTPAAPFRGPAESRQSARDVAATLAALNDVLDQANVGLRYRVDEATEDIIVSLVNRESGEVVRQIPAEAILKMRQRMQELLGEMFDVTA